MTTIDLNDPDILRLFLMSDRALRGVDDPRAAEIVAAREASMHRAARSAFYVDERGYITDGHGG